jgi:hypothetical protein
MLTLQPRVSSIGTYTIQCDLDFFCPSPVVGRVHNGIRVLASYLRWPFLNFDPTAGPGSAPSLTQRMRGATAATAAPRPPSLPPAGVYSGGGGHPSGGGGPHAPGASGVWASAPTAAAPSVDTVLASPGSLFVEPVPFELQVRLYDQHTVLL